MPQRIARYLRCNAIALLALFVALGGTSYAALTISGRQIRNRSVDAVKLNPHSIAASIKAWANVQFRFGGGLIVQGSNSPVRVITGTTTEEVIWTRQRFSAKCIVSATPQSNLRFGGDAFVTVQLNAQGRSRAFNSVFLSGTGSNGAVQQPQAAFVMVICP